MNRFDVLFDDVLLEIFDFYVDINLSYGGRRMIEAWQSLAHVCRRWRRLVFGSPIRLNLQLLCTPETPAKDKLDIWPALPLVVRGDINMAFAPHMDNIIAALEQSNRVCEVFLLDLEDWQLEEVLAAMQVPFPELRDLQLSSRGGTLSVIPDSFLDGSTPRLQVFSLGGIPIAGFPNLLLSTTHLLSLTLFDIPHSGYISPEAIVVLLRALSSLEKLSLGFQSPESRPDQGGRRSSPSKRSVLPALRRLDFKGVTDYLEKLVTCIDTPQLDEIDITFFHQSDFDCPQLTQFINRTPTLGERNKARVEFGFSSTSVTLLPWTRTFAMKILCRDPGRQLSSIAEVCNSSLYHPLSTVEDLYIERQSWRCVWKIDTIESTPWLQLLLPFTVVKNLCLFEEFAPCIGAALQELVGERITEVFPSLRNIYVEGLEPSGRSSFRENVEQFVVARQLSGHPVAISVWDEDSGMGWF